MRVLLESVTDFLSVRESPELWETLGVASVVEAMADVVAVKSKCRFLARLRVVLRISEFSKGIDTVETIGWCKRTDLSNEVKVLRSTSILEGLVRGVEILYVSGSGVSCVSCCLSPPTSRAVPLHILNTIGGLFSSRLVGWASVLLSKLSTTFLTDTFATACFCTSCCCWCSCCCCCEGCFRMRARPYCESGTCL